MVPAKRKPGAGGARLGPAPALFDAAEREALALVLDGIVAAGSRARPDDDGRDAREGPAAGRGGVALGAGGPCSKEPGRQ